MMNGGEMLFSSFMEYLKILKNGWALLYRSDGTSLVWKHKRN